MVLPNVYKTKYKIVIVVFFSCNHNIRLLIFISISSSIRMCIISFMSFGQYHSGVVDCFGMYNVVGWFKQHIKH